MSYYNYKNFLENNINIKKIFFNNKFITTEERIDFSKNYLKGKKILNIGCLNHSLNSYNKQHDDIIKLGNLVIGVDIIEEAKKIGDNIEIGNIMDKEFINKLKNTYGDFDIIFAGELIERLENYILFFENCHSLLRQGGNIIITTPNPYGLHYFYNVLLFKYLKYGNLDHKFFIDHFQLTYNIKGIFNIVDFSFIQSKGLERRFLKLFNLHHLGSNYLCIFSKI